MLFFFIVGIAAFLT